VRDLLELDRCVPRAGVDEQQIGLVEDRAFPTPIGPVTKSTGTTAEAFYI
jgi:hypothetical protein